MRPLVLKMQAFGPYASRETVDFRRALENGLFGIYGATGSGKSSIFSAMTFALFGEATKVEQSTRTLRSDYADPGLLTEVELIFEVGERCYRVVRRPDQIRPAKRGTGATEEKHKAWLFDVTGLDTDRLGEDLPGKPIAESKVSVVDQAVVDILGYEAAQFRQIVLLPQGRFETFLNAKTEHRVAILRELFDVSIYETMAERLKARSKEVRDEIVRRRDVASALLAHESFESIDQLVDGIAASKRQCEDLVRAKADADDAFRQADAAYQQAAQTDRFFAEHADAEKQVQALLSRAPSNEADEARLKRARAAAALAPRADAVSGAERASEKARHARDDAARRRQRADAEAKAAEDQSKALDARAGEIEARRDILRRLEGYAADLASAETLRRVHGDAERAADECQRAFSAAEKRHDERAEGHQLLLSEREAARKTQVQRGALRLRAMEIGARLKAAQEYEKADGALTHSREHHARVFAAHEAQTRRSEQARDELDEAEAALLESQALHLAAHLEPGQPCPVCGSREHPAPASGTEKKADLGARYREAKAAFDDAQRQSAAATSALAEAGALLRQREEALSNLAQPEVPAAVIAQSFEAVRRDIEALGAERDMGELDARVDEAAQALTDAQAALRVARDARDNARLDANRAKTELESALASIPEELRGADRLDAAKRHARDRIDAHDHARREADQAKQKAYAARASAETELELAERAILTAEEAQKEAQARFDLDLAGFGLARAAFEAARGDLGRIDEIQDRIRSFGEQLAAAKDRLARAERAIAEADRPDIVAIKEARDAAEDRQRRCFEDTTKATQRAAQLEKLHGETTAELAALDRMERESGPLRSLASLFSGDNDARTDLETFAIATMFDHVLAAANLRLEPMSRGRFRLFRGSEEQGRARRGLDIVVEDSFTGRPRPTSTLSGGETFIAALALALGLSDIVESTRGNVRLDTIFIDEGFGSLDSTDDAGTLDQVLQSLTELVGKRRAVGLISHVPLVQQTVQSGFWVTSLPGGSHIEERI